MTASHSHHHHPPAADQRGLLIALGLIASLMVAELTVGILAHSLALMSDAAHMLTDAGALVLALVAARLALRPARGAMTYGLGRVEILAAQANGATLLVLAGFVIYSAITRLVSPPQVHAVPVIVLACAGIVVNAAATAALAGGARASLNVEGAFRHLLTDLYAFIGTLVAGIVILAGGFQRADPLASLLVAALMLRSAYVLLKASGRVLFEAAPPGLDPAVIGTAMASQSGVVEVHDLHVWELRSGFPALSAHVLVRADADCHEARRRIEAMLRERFELGHTTLQVEHAGDGGDLIALEPLR